MIKNPILRGFNPDPCICRKQNDYFIAVSSFEWFPGIPVYHSKDLKHWELYTHILTDDSKINLGRLTSGQGIWAPCLSYCKKDDLFYIVYGIVEPNGMNVDNYLVSAKDIRGPWSEPVYLQSSGFDASLFHDDDGRKWLVSLEWERREGYQKPGAICMAEYDAQEKRLVGYPKRIWSGGTTRGWIEGPHLYKHRGRYYLLCAEGGTGYHHCSSVARAEKIWGPYEGDPANPVITSIVTDGSEGRTKAAENLNYYNPEIRLQKAGHASLVDTTEGEYYAVHLCVRPHLPELRCTLGRETALAKMVWTKDGWLRKKNGSPLPEDVCEESIGKEYEMPQIELHDDFDGDELGIQYYAPHYMPQSFADVKARKGYVRIRGQQVLDSFNKISLLARKITSVHMEISTKMEFYPEVHQHTAGLALFYDNLNYFYLRKYYSETLGQSALSVVQSENGKVTEYLDSRVPVSDQPVVLKMKIEGHTTYFEWSYKEEFEKIGPDLDTTKLSDEYCGEFTGTFAGIACTDGVFRKKTADFDYFDMKELEGKENE